MEVTLNKLNELKGKNPYKLPEGYMEGLTEQIMSRIPEITYAETKVVSLRDRMHLWLYAVAVFAGLLIFLRVFLNPVPQNNDQQNETSSYLQAFVFGDLLKIISDDDLEYLEYIENQLLDREFAEEIDNMVY